MTIKFKLYAWVLALAVAAGVVGAAPTAFAHPAGNAQDRTMTTQEANTTSKGCARAETTWHITGTTTKSTTLSETKTGELTKRDTSTATSTTRAITSRTLGSAVRQRFTWKV